MALTGWIKALEAGGRLKVPLGAPPVDDPEWTASLAALADRAAWELPGPAPALATPAAAWAAARVLIAAQAIAHRGQPDDLADALESPCPGALDPSVAWSVDLTLRQLPRLLGLARGFADDEPLSRGLRALARDWPLSSVGVVVDDLDPARLAPVLAHPSLRRCYVDRVLARGARDRLASPTVAAAARAALGAHPTLCPALADTLGAPAPESTDADRS